MARKWWTLIAVSVATFMLLLDITVVNTALPSIQKDLGASFTDLQWVIDAYTLALAAVVLTAGSLADRLGRRARVRGRARDLLGRLAGGGARTGRDVPQHLARGPGDRRRGDVRGVAGAGRPGVRRRPRARPWRWASTAPRSASRVAVGPLVGGAITSWFGWRWVFFLNVPIGIAAIAVTFAKLRESRDPNATRDRLARARELSTALLMLVLALLRGNDRGLGQPADPGPARWRRR